MMYIIILLNIVVSFIDHCVGNNSNHFPNFHLLETDYSKMSFLPCLVAFWRFHPYMFFHFFKCFFVTYT